MDVVAINIWPSNYPLQEWVSFWGSTGASQVLLAQDVNNRAVRDYQLVALGTEVIIDRQGSVAFRSDRAAGYKKLKSEIQKLL